MEEVYRSSHLGVTLEKLRRDAQKLRQFARFVLILNEDQVVVIDNGHLRSEGLPYARLIAVVGPVQHKDILLEESTLLEIGYSRTRPYAQIEQGATREKKADGKNGHRTSRSWFMKPRVRIRHLTDEDLARVYPHIVRCMEQVVLECRENWRVKGAWYVDGPGEIERGIYFTVHRSDALLHRQFLGEDVRYRRGKYIRKHAHWIGRVLLRKYKFSHYSVKQLRSFARAQRVVEVLSQEHYTSFYRVALCRLFKAGSKTRLLLELIMDVFGLDVVLAADEECVFQSVPITLPFLVNLRCERPVMQPTVQARDCTTFEVFLERRYREKNEIPF